MDTPQGKRGRRCFVIFVSPQPHGEPEPRYISKDGLPTTYRHEAAKFDTSHDAKDFAKHKNIDLTAMTFIAEDDFTEFEIC